ncbi:MAG: uroporphyrinogen decarboxylase family protein [Candidatus Bathyarchaeia archaeon]
MNERDRFIATVMFKDADRYPYWELGIWGQTYERWLQEGLSEEDLKGDWFRGEPKFAKLDRRDFIPLNLGPIPGLKQIIIEENDRYVVFRDEWGRIRKALKEGTIRGTRPSMDAYLDFFVKDRESFLEIKKHFDPYEPSRYPKNWEELKNRWKNRDYPLYLTENCGFGGLYWNLRQMMGTLRLSTAFYRMPNLVHEILDFMVDFFIKATEKALKEIEVDAFIFNEDFAYKKGPLFSPKIFRDFLLPRYEEIIKYLRKHGVKVIELDSDGNTEILIPMFIEVGINAHWPLEAAAGMNPIEIRKKYGEEIALYGGIDKRVLTMSKKDIEKEVYNKILPMMELGGYIPFIDHTIPPDVPLENFLYYLDLKRKIAEGFR